MGCGNKLKHTCGTRINARCVFYDGKISEDSPLFEEECITIEETTEDLYIITDTINAEIDLSELGNSCLDYEEEEAGNILVKEALLKFEEEICTLKEVDTTDVECCIDLTKIDTKCLVDECGTNFATPEFLIQAIIDKLCELMEIGTTSVTVGENQVAV